MRSAQTGVKFLCFIGWPRYADYIKESISFFQDKACFSREFVYMLIKFSVILPTLIFFLGASVLAADVKVIIDSLKNETDVTSFEPKFKNQSTGLTGPEKQAVADGLLLKLASTKKLDIVKYLVETAGANVNVKDNWAVTPLYRAVNGEKLEVVEYLIGKGADVNCK